MFIIGIIVINATQQVDLHTILVRLAQMVALMIVLHAVPPLSCIPGLEVIAEHLVRTVTGEILLHENANLVGAGQWYRDLLRTTPVQHAHQGRIMIASHVVLPLSFIHIMEVTVGILVQTDSGGAQVLLDNVFLATAMELAHTAARLAMEEQAALALPASQGPFVIAHSVSILVLQDTGEIRKQMFVSRATALAQHAPDQRVMNVSPVILDTFTLDSVFLLVLLDTMHRQKLASFAG